MHKEENIGQVELATMTFRTVLSGDTDSAGNDSECSGQWRKAGDTAFWSRSIGEDRKRQCESLRYDDEKQIVSEKTSETMQELAGECCVRRIREKCKDRRIPYRRKDGYVPDTSKKCEQIYFFFYRVCTGRQSADSGNVCDL